MPVHPGDGSGDPAGRRLRGIVFPGSRTNRSGITSEPSRSSGTGRIQGKNRGVSAEPTEDLLQGIRVLVVEDEAAISMLLEDMLLDFGCDVVGPAARLATALEMAGSESFDVAILDVNVAGEPIYPVAEAIASRDLPLVFSTGYGGAGIREPFRDRPVVQKPFSQSDLKRTLIGAIKAKRG